jgi:hypothetical protein
MMSSYQGGWCCSGSFTHLHSSTVICTNSSSPRNIYRSFCAYLCRYDGRTCSDYSLQFGTIWFICICFRSLSPLALFWQFHA